MKRWLIIILLAGASLFLYLLYFNSNTELHTVEAELTSTQEQLDSAKTGLAATEGELNATKTELQSTVIALDSTKIKLQAMEENWQSAETELAATLDRLSTAQAELDDRETELSELQINYEGLMTGHGYTIKDPSYNDMLRFLEEDDTDKAEYIEDEYECIEFTTDLCNRAEEKGIRCAYVSVRFPDGRGHAIVAFNTIDKDLIYIEPQYDDLVNIVIGKPFYKCVVPKEGVTYVKPSHDDTILEVLVAW